MIKKAHEIRKSTYRLKAQLTSSFQDGKLILSNIRKAQDGLTHTLNLIPNLAAFISKVNHELLPALQKESAEAIAAGAKVLEAMEVSSKCMKTILNLLTYLYGKDHPRTLEFLTPSNWKGVGRNAFSRIMAHRRIDEASSRHKDDFSGKITLDFKTAEAAGANLEQAWNKFIIQEQKASKVIKDCMTSLSDYRKLRRKIRNWLNSELDNPKDVYLYVPKQKRKKRAVKKNSEGPTED